MKPVPEPDVMPVNREEWRRELHLSNFVNTYYQIRDLQRLGAVRRVLVIGPGQGFDTAVFRWRGYEVVTFDIDETFAPYVVGSVHDMARFGPGEFDAAIASHVLEHFAEPYLEAALAEIARVSRFALVYLPVAGRHAQVRVVPGFHGFDWSWIGDLFNFFHRPDGVTPRYCQGQHFWEVGYRGFRKSDLSRRFGRHFEVLDCYRNRDWLPSLNYVLRSRRVGQPGAPPSEGASLP
jgi:SAM-dependent methyltransferase